MSDLQLSGKRVLLLGSNERAALSVCRSLGRQGVIVEIAAFEAMRQPAELSRYCKDRINLGCPVTDPLGVRARLMAHMQANAYDALFPITDVACELVYGEGSTFGTEVAIVGPDTEGYRQAVDKSQALGLAKQVGLNTPETILLHQGEDTAAAFAALAEGPVYAKPVRSCLLSDGFTHMLDVKKCTQPAQFERKLAEDLPRAPLMVQKPVAGHGVGVNLLADRGALVAISMNRRLHEPPDGGGSSFRCNVPVTDAALEAARGIAEALNWSGLMMIELKEEGDQLTIMEMNCRPWGSIETALRAGVDFPALALAVALGQPVPEQLVRSDTNARVRNLKNDLRWVIGQRRKWLSWPSPLLDWLGAPLRAIRGREHLDIEQADDLMPALGQFNPVVARVWWRGMLGLTMIMARRRYKHRFRRVDRDTPLLFLCQGNINRSALADILFRQAGYQNVQSAGILPFHGRAISPVAARYLERLGLDGKTHRSRNFQTCQEFVASGATIVVFDFRTLADMHIAHPELRDQLVLFDDFSRQETGELRDPHGTQEAEYIECFERIAAILHDQIDEKD